MCVCVCVCVCVRVRACVHVCVCVCIHVYMYVYLVHNMIMSYNSVYSSLQQYIMELFNSYVDAGLKFVKKSCSQGIDQV